ncbi:MAG: hypothetical protein Q7S20_13565 [Gemmatimonadaceae bacterium]|nr:hypothetical protein [Gemmatimonadaceae bacterium]
MTCHRFAIAFLAAALVGGAPLSLRAQAAEQRSRDSLIGVDKVKHFFIAGFLESVSFASLQAAGAGRRPALSGAIGLTTAASIGRELHDRRTKGLFSLRDLVWDALGAGAAFLILSRTQK